MASADGALAEQVAALTEQVKALTARIADLQKVADQFTAEHEIDEETMMVISAAVAAVLGHKAKVKQVHFRHGSGWTTAGRMEVQDHSKRPLIRPARIGAR